MHSLTHWQLSYSNAFWLSRPGVCYDAKALIGAEGNTIIDVQKACGGLPRVASTIDDKLPAKAVYSRGGASPFISPDCAAVDAPASLARWIGASPRPCNPPHAFCTSI